MLLAAAALAVAGGLVSLQREHDRCRDATASAFLATHGHGDLGSAADRLIADCSGSEPLARMAVGLRVERPRIAARLARAATEREPDGYAAWAVLAVSASGPEAATAAERAGALNPLSVGASP